MFSCKNLFKYYINILITKYLNLLIKKNDSLEINVLIQLVKKKI